jgi:hypothetical protein
MNWKDYYLLQKKWHLGSLSSFKYRIPRIIYDLQNSFELKP